jgi:hypothetical protein
LRAAEERAGELADRPPEEHPIARKVQVRADPGVEAEQEELDDRPEAGAETDLGIAQTRLHVADLGRYEQAASQAVAIGHGRLRRSTQEAIDQEPRKIDARVECMMK